ncbi:MAG: ribosomal-processing cysteine protease Prp [Bacillota bacterium]
MVEVTIDRNQAGEVVSFKASGHAEYAEHGRDIVCAAVSAILQTAIFGLTEYLDLEVEVSQEDGWLSCDLSEIKNTEEVNAILETMVVGLEKTVDSYSDRLRLTEGGKNND